MTALRGTCPVCGKRKRVTREGFIYDHMRRNALWYCPGSWKRPEGTEEAFAAIDERQRQERRELTKELCS